MIWSNYKFFLFFKLKRHLVCLFLGKKILNKGNLGEIKQLVHFALQASLMSMHWFSYLTIFYNLLCLGITISIFKASQPGNSSLQPEVKNLWSQRVLLGNLLEMQIIGLIPDPLNQELWEWNPVINVFKRPHVILMHP